MLLVNFLNYLLILVIVVACKGGGPAPSDSPVVGIPTSPTTPAATPTPVPTVPPIVGPTVEQIGEAEKYLAEKADQLEIFLEKELALELSMENAVDIEKLNWRAAFLAKEHNRDFSFEKAHQLINIQKDFARLHGAEVLEKTSAISKNIWENFKKFSEDGELVYQIKRRTYKFLDFCLDHKTFEDRDPNIIRDVEALKNSFGFGHTITPQNCLDAIQKIEADDTILFDEFSGVMLGNLDVLRGLRNLKMLGVPNRSWQNYRKKINLSSAWAIPNLEELQIYQADLKGEEVLKELKKIKRISFLLVKIDSLDWMKELKNLELIEFNDVRRISTNVKRYDLNFLSEILPLQRIVLHDVDVETCPDPLGRSDSQFWCQSTK